MMLQIKYRSNSNETLKSAWRDVTDKLAPFLHCVPPSLSSPEKVTFAVCRGIPLILSDEEEITGAILRMCERVRSEWKNFQNNREVICHLSLRLEWIRVAVLKLCRTSFDPESKESERLINLLRSVESVCWMLNRRVYPELSELC